MKRVVTLSLAATAVVASPALEVKPEVEIAGSVCSQAPYKQWLPLSTLSAAKSYCSKEFPVTRPTCLTTFHPAPTIQRSTETDTLSLVFATVQTATTGAASTTVTTITV